MDLYENVFDPEEIVAGIAEWAAIESPSFDAAAVNQMMDLAQSAMVRLGATVERMPGANGFGDIVCARFPWGEGPGILVLGHLDTVHLVGTLAGMLAVRRDGDRLYGPGVLDMKGGMYLAVHAIEKVIERRERLNLPVTFMFIPDEEIGSPSTRALIEAEAHAHRYVLVPEPGKPDKFVTGRHAFLRYKLHTYGKPAHAGVAKGIGRSAISVMAQLIAQVEGFSDVEREVTYRVGNVNGGDFVNVVPTECHAEVLCVAPTPAAFEEVKSRMGSLVSLDPEVRLEVEPGPIRPLFTMHEASRDLFEVAQRVAREVGLDLDHGQFGGGSDGNFTGALGIPTLDGLGVCGDGVHTKQEHLLVSSLVPRARLIAGLFEALSERNR
ncbi:MAG: carboxypeptidase [Rhodospirillaceae bacterium]|nr:carboxypeptidase [Rhodospirillaceae bacterium]|tara:strand:- start:1442 stop:2584 length:1143 start_codon:yes stop_codon:yes gene_type:complete